MSSNGICNKYSNDPKKLERACNTIDKNICASTSCCVLLGGTKCVAGDQYGPMNLTNYTDAISVNRDYYYYNGNCYGNCY
jgi:hypothetical protein